MTHEAEVTATFVRDVGQSLYASNSTLPLPPYWTAPWRVGLTLTLAVIMCAAVVGNSLVVVVVLRNRGMRTRTNLFLCNLAVADLLCATIDMPFSLITVASGSWIFNDVVCKLNGFALPFLFVASIHTLMYMSIHKYLSLASPFRRSLSTRSVVAMMAGAWLWAAVAGASTVSPLTDVVYKPGTTQCGPRYPSDAASLAHFFFVVVSCYAVPMLVVGVCNALTFAVIRGHGARMRLHSTEEWRRIRAQQRRIAVTLLLVVLSFAVAWTPWVVYAFYVIFASGHDVRPPAVVNPITYWCIYLNSVCNPVIYALRSEAFLEGYKQVLCAGSKSFVSESGSQRSTMSRNCVDKVEAATTSAAILNNVVGFTADNGDGSRWASLEHHGRGRRPRRLQTWAADDLDDWTREHVRDDTAQTTFDDEDADAGKRDQETALSLRSVRAVVESFDDSSTEHHPGDDERSPAVFQHVDFTKSDRTKSAGVALTLSLESGPTPDAGVGFALAGRACSEGDVLSGVDAAAAGTGRSSRLLSCASTLFGRLLSPTRQRLATLSVVEWRRRCGEASRRQYGSSGSFHDVSAVPEDRSRLSRQSGGRTATSADDDQHEGTSTTPCDVQRPSVSGSVGSRSSRQLSRRQVPHPSTSSSSAVPPAGTDVAAPEDSAKWNHAAAERTRSSKCRPAMIRHPSIERLDLPRRRVAAETPTSVDARSPFGADRKRAERFRRQYIDVKLRRQAMPTPTNKSMPAGVNECGTSRHVIASPQLQVPATADVTLV